MTERAMKSIKHIRFTIILIALCAQYTTANGQNGLKNDTLTSSACKASKDWIASDFYGDWVLEISEAGATNASGMTQSTRLLFKQNPEFAESLAGEFSLNGWRMEVFGDIEAGALDLEESANGKDISAIWKGGVSEGSCAKAITGTRRILASQTEQRFVLRRAGW
jgi:hypothetical protein